MPERHLIFIHALFRSAQGLSLWGLLCLAACTQSIPTPLSPLPEQLAAVSAVPPPAPAFPTERTPAAPLPEEAPVAATPAPDLSAATAPDSAETTPPEPAPVEIGYESVATYYARRFEGRRTATGERYDPKKLTAATRDVPLGTLVKVINPANGREVIVRVNDRPRKRSFPLIDLSRTAAQKLGFLGQGKIRVRVIPLPATASN